MYNIYNKANVFYLYDFYDETMKLLGNENDVVEYLSRQISTNGYRDSSRWELDFLSNQNLTGNDLTCILKGSLSYPEKTWILKRFAIVDGDYRILDARFFMEKAFGLYSFDECGENAFWSSKRRNPKKKRRYSWQYPSHRPHCGNRFKHKMPRTHRTLVQNSIPECRDFVRRRDKEFPKWCDDTSRRVSCCWKDQYKDRKQYEHRNK